MSELFTAADLLAELRAAVSDAGGCKRFAEGHAVSESLVSHTLAGKIDVGARIAAALDFVPVPMFRAIKRTEQGETNV